jgi:hypothetical protein
MRPLERINLIRAIDKHLVQSQWTEGDMSAYIEQYSIQPLYVEDEWDNRRFNLKLSLSNEKVPNERIIEIAKELGISDKLDDVIANEESNCWTLGFHKMFISHLTANKTSAANLKQCLSEYAISGFVAHEDIEPSSEWREEIERALFSMDSLCAIVTPDFIKSVWCDQEVGVAIGRKALVIPICKDADPYGLFGKYQGIRSKGKDANTIADEIFKIVSSNEKSKTAYGEIIRNLILNAKNTDEGLKWFNLLKKMPLIDSSIIKDLHSKFASNSNLNDKTILAIANRVFIKHNLNELGANVFVSNEIELDDLPF